VKNYIFFAILFCLTFFFHLEIPISATEAEFIKIQISLE
jgi:hypothetical protein